MTTLDKIKLIDFYLHGVDRDLWDFEIPSYDTSLDALRPVIVKLYQTEIPHHLLNKRHQIRTSVDFYIKGDIDFTPVFDSVVECINYLNEKKDV